MKRLIGGFSVAALLLLVSVTIPVSDSGRAFAEDNGVGQKPVMGCWSFYGHDPTLYGVEAQAKAIVREGLKKVGFTYVLLDDFWYVCPGPKARMSVSTATG